ncbi:unnamed protein product [Caenorhabditis sp. 36 PRJEB53466]|nr:unnamed protein product [Caenorhabditis sp. 36 PRJEB53466]
MEMQSLSFAWAESNYFGFVSIHAAVSALCLFEWTKNGLVPKYAHKLGKVRTLRLSSNEKMDNYRLIQVLALLFSLPWLFAMMSWIIYNTFHRKILFGGNETNIIFCIIICVSNFYVWFISSICLTFYFIIFSSVNREVEHFNKEFENAKKHKTLKNIGVLEKFDFRQNEILEMIVLANDSLWSFGSYTPLFMFYGLGNGVYLTGFMDAVPLVYFVILCVILASIIIFNLITVAPAVALQEKLAATTCILINNDEFECSKDPIVYQTYRVMVDRLHKVDTRIYVISAIPITKSTLAASLFIVPNLGFLLLMAKKVIIANGGHVN